MQNIYYAEDKAATLMSFPSPLLQDLAGNAFQTNCAAALTLATLVVYARLRCPEEEHLATSGSSSDRPSGAGVSAEDKLARDVLLAGFDEGSSQSD